MAKVLDAKSLGESFRSARIEVSGLRGYSLHGILSSISSTSGELKLAASNKPDADPLTAADWVDIDGTAQAVTTTSTHMWDISNRNYRYVQFVYTRTAGSASLDVYMESEPLT